jgi:hypothetical protein
MCSLLVRGSSQVFRAVLIFKGDTLYIMAGLGLLDMVGEDVYKANEVTAHLVAYPTKIHGILHL